VSPRCPRCGKPVQAYPDAMVLACRSCSVLFEPGSHPPVLHEPSVAQPTSSLALSDAPRYLACWRFGIDIETEEQWCADPTLRRMRKAAQPQEPRVYVPAYSQRRPVVQHLGASLVEAQPELALDGKLPDEQAARAVTVFPVQPRPPGSWEDEPSGVLSPVLVGRRDAALLANLVYLAVQARDLRESHAVNQPLSLRDPRLLFLPASRDPRYIHEAGWRLLLREFDGVVA
jgi:hypothetical protein